MRHVADRMPDQGKRGKDSAILADGAGCLQKNFESRNCVTWVTTKLFLHTQVWWWHEAKCPPTRHSIRADADALRRLLALCDILRRRASMIAHRAKRTSDAASNTWLMSTGEALAVVAALTAVALAA